MNNQDKRIKILSQFEIPFGIKYWKTLFTTTTCWHSTGCKDLWYQLELNQRPADFQSDALPAELWYLLFQRNAKIQKKTIQKHFFQKKIFTF